MIAPAIKRKLIYDAVYEAQSHLLVRSIIFIIQADGTLAEVTPQ